MAVRACALVMAVVVALLSMASVGAYQLPGLLRASVARKSAFITMRGGEGSKKVIIAGAPASGKGTQCEMIKSEFGLVHLSTGDMLRAAVAQGTDVGKKAKAYMDAGDLVPDEVIIGVVVERLKAPDCESNGWLLDGFPRTAVQAEALRAAGVEPDVVLYLNVPDEILVDRVVGRRTDPDTGRIYHLTYDPPPPEVAERCTQRSDDTAEKALVRLKAFHTHLGAILDTYKEITTEVDGTRPKAEVFADVQKVLS